MGLIRPQPLNSSGDTLNATNMADESIDELDCGISLCRGHKLCGGLIRFARPAVFVTVLSILGLIQGEVEGYFYVHYSTNSTDISLQFVKWMFFGSYVLQLLIVVPLCYTGGKRSRPFWLACFGGFAALTCIIFGILVLVIYSNNDVSTTYSLTQDPTLCVLWSEKLITDNVNWNWLTLVMLYLIHYSIGLSSVGFLSLGITFVDDNANMETSPALIGVVLAVRQLGPKLGIIIAMLCYSTTVTGILWIILGVFFIIISFIMSLFSRQLTDSNGILITSASRQFGSTDRGIFRSILRVVTNKIFIFVTLALVLMNTAFINFENLQSTYEESVYYATKPNGFDDPWTARVIAGYFHPALTALAILLSGLIIYKFKPSASRISIWSVISVCLVASLIFSNIFLTCSKLHIHNESDNKFDLKEYCNKDCQCSSSLPFTPVCAKNGGTVFYSPCHAGCTTVNSNDTKVYQKCLCVPTQSVTAGLCHYGACAVYWVSFQFILVFTAMLLSSVIVGNIIICFRAVLGVDKPIMIALQTTLIALIANFPGKLFYDFVGSWSCMFPGRDSCRLHISQPFATFINLLTVVLLLGAAGIFTIVCFLVRNLQLHSEQGSTPKPTEMTEFRSQLNTVLKRRSLKGEDQKLLGKPVPQIIIKPAIAGNEHRISTYEAQRQKAASYSEELNKLLQSSPLIQNQSQGKSQTDLQGDVQTRSPGETIRKEGMLTTLL